MFFPSHHENEQMSFHHYVYVYIYASIYHSYSIHRESLMCCYSTRRTHAISSNGQNTRRKKCQNPQELAKSAQKTPSILRFYTSKRHKHIWHFNAYSLALFRTTATHTRAHTRSYTQKMMKNRWLKFLLSFFSMPWNAWAEFPPANGFLFHLK